MESNLPTNTQDAPGQPPHRRAGSRGTGPASELRRIELETLSIGHIPPIAWGTIRRWFSIREWIASWLLMGFGLLLLLLAATFLGAMLSDIGPTEGSGALGAVVLSGEMIAVATVPAALVFALGFSGHTAWRLAVWKVDDGAPWTTEQIRSIGSAGLRSFAICATLFVFATSCYSLMRGHFPELLLWTAIHAACFVIGSVTIAQSLIDERPMTRQIEDWFDTRMLRAIGVTIVSGAIAVAVLGLITMIGTWVLLLELHTATPWPLETAFWNMGATWRLLPPMAQFPVALWVTCAATVAVIAGTKALLAALVRTSDSDGIVDDQALDESDRTGQPGRSALAVACALVAAVVFLTIRGGPPPRPVQTPAEYHGSWRSTQPGCSYLFELYPDGSFEASPEVCGISTRNFIGHWYVEHNKMVWLYGPAMHSRPDANPILVKTAERFELRELDGKITIFTRPNAQLPVSTQAYPHEGL